MRYWIHDRDDTPMGMPLEKLVQELRRRFPSVTGCSVTRAEGAGETIFRWNRRLDRSDAISVEVDALQLLCAEGQEWFYWFDARLDEPNIRFGLHDSTALFVEGEGSSMEAIIKAFTDVRDGPKR